MNPIFLVCYAFAHAIHGFVVVDKLTVNYSPLKRLAS
jgi:hypothetical protein